MYMYIYGVLLLVHFCKLQLSSAEEDRLYLKGDMYLAHFKLNHSDGACALYGRRMSRK